MHTNSQHTVSVFHPLECTLGEGPVWDSATQTFFCVDIDGKKLYEYDWEKQTLQVHGFAHRVSLVIPGTDGNLVLGMQGGIARFNPRTGDFTWITDLGLNWQNHRCNDGACDIKGRLWIGTMELDCKEQEGSLYCIERDGTVTEKISRVSVSNGLAWSQDNKWLFYTDSPTRQVSSYRFDESSGEILFEKVAIQVPDNRGMPDGVAMDEEGMLWVALWDGFGVGRWDLSTGQLIDFIPVPAPHVSSCAFAGPQLDELVITTARKEMTDEELNQYPESGHVFIVKPGVRGLARFPCSL